MKVNLPQGVLNCELLSDFQIKPCDPKAELKKQLIDRRNKKLEHTYPGMIHKFEEQLPPDVKRQIQMK